MPILIPIYLIPIYLIPIYLIPIYLIRSPILIPSRSNLRIRTTC